MNRMNGII